MQPFHFPLLALARAAVLLRRISGALALAFLFQFIPAHWQSAYAQTRPQPFDPLTAAERETALRLAEDNARVKELRGGGRQRLISVELSTAKTANSESRSAEVLYYRYDGNQGILALIDLGQRNVREAARINGDAVPLVAEEVNEALALALRNQTVTNLLGPNYREFRVATPELQADQPNRVEALRSLASSPNDPCYQHRCLVLLFRQGENYLTEANVTVDLTAQTVRRGQPAPKNVRTQRRKK